VQAGQTLNLAIYQSGALQVEQSLNAVAQARAEVERIEAKAAAERDAMMRRRVRLQKLGERGQEERRQLSAAARSSEQQQLDELWLNGHGSGRE
jgi:flagellar biosynthesis chaperone FliJ